MRVALLRAALGAALAALLVGLDAPAARAGDDSAANESTWNKVMEKLGLKRPPGADAINYMERPPLVVPPNRDLPPPSAAGPPPVPDWPTNAPSHKRAQVKPGIVPDTAVQTPNPQNIGKPWYDPLGLFHHEEYGTFAGEPVRQNLTDPPAGYRIPSPNEPYGVGGKGSGGKSQASAADLNMTAAPQPGQSGK